MLGLTLPPMTEGRWFHVTASVDEDGNRRLYVDGVLVEPEA